MYIDDVFIAFEFGYYVYDLLWFWLQDSDR